MRRFQLLPNARFLLLAALLRAACAQDAGPSPKTRVKGPEETMVVLGSATPVPLGESERSVEILPVHGQSLAAESAQDFLRKDSPVFLEERGAGGGQADIVMRGGSFEQTLVLLNGFRINDAQTSHHNLDLPVPLDAIDSIQALAGAGSTLHGVDALSGVVDFLTAAPDHESLFLRTGEGSFQSNEETLLGGAARGKWSGRMTAERNFSTGFMADRDYRNEDASGESWLGSRLGVTDLLFASSEPVLRRSSVVGADQGLVRRGAAGAGQSHRRGFWGSPPHGRVRALAQRSLNLREQPRRRFVASVAARNARGAQGFRAADGP